MSRARRPLTLLLAALVALAGVSVDLCACGVDGHGALCAVAAPAAEVEPCCAPLPAHPCRAEAPAGEPQVRAADCACPELELEVTPTTADADGAQRFAPVDPAPIALQPPPAPPDAAPQAAWLAHALAPPPPLRRHLLLHVLRC